MEHCRRTSQNGHGGNRTEFELVLQITGYNKRISSRIEWKQRKIHKSLAKYNKISRTLISEKRASPNTSALFDKCIVLYFAINHKWASNKNKRR